MAAAELATGSILSGFRIESLLGRGGMGVVYRATQLSLERQVALKLISPELAHEERFRERFLREARLAASLEHPHLLPVHEVGEQEGTLFLAMRLVEGASLAEVLRREGRLAPERALRIFGQLGQALGAAHEAGLLHRDVKPQNVLLAGEGEREHAYLCDFGLSRRLSGGSLTGERAFLGTARYAAPEQIRGEKLDERCDLYSLACLLYECLTGAPPFAAEDELALAWAHLHEPAPAPSTLDPALSRLDRFFAKALAKDPAERFPMASELAEAARSALEAWTVAAPTTAPAPAPQLPRPLTSFLGRERELQDVLALLLDDDVRLLTLSGPGGTGKTRLALRAAEEAAPSFPDGIYWVGLAALRDPALVTETIARTLAAKDGLAEHVGDHRLLLLLDNLEQVIEAAPELASLLQACPNLSLLVTSRELLRVQGEQEYEVPPLVEPEAVELFCARAQREPSAEIAELCARLDSLPLAVELAAARTKALTPAQILERLSQRLDLLKGGRDADPRQQTLRATIEWSYDLLSEEEQRLFRALSVFAGGCTLEAAEEVADADLDTLQSLVEKSLLRFSNGRYWMLETVREYAVERLAAAGEPDDMRRRHAGHFAALTDMLVDLTGVGFQAAFAAIRIEAENLRSTLEWAIGNDVDAAYELTGRLDRYWYVTGLYDESLLWCERVLNEVPSRPALRHKLLRRVAEMHSMRGNYDRAREVLAEALELAWKLEDSELFASCCIYLGHLACYEGKWDEGQRFYEDALAIFETSGGLYDLILGRLNLGWALFHNGALERARSVLTIALSGARDLGTSEHEAVIMTNLAHVELGEQRFPQVQQLAEAAFQLALELELKLIVAESIELLSRAAAAQGDDRRAGMLAGAAARLRSELGVPEATGRTDLLDASRERLGAAAWDGAVERGMRMDAADVAELVRT